MVVVVGVLELVVVMVVAVVLTTGDSNHALTPELLVASVKLDLELSAAH